MKRSITIMLLLFSCACIYFPIFTVPEKQIKIYTYPKCPYCVNVKNFLIKHNWHNRVVFIDANEPEHYADLLRISKKDFCPYLVDEINNVNMGDSKKIIKHLETIFNDL